MLNLCQNSYFPLNPLPKYNVPKTNLVTGQHVLDAFNTQIVKGKQKLHDAIKLVHDHYVQELGALADYAKLANIITHIITLMYLPFLKHFMSFVFLLFFPLTLRDLFKLRGLQASFLFPN